MKRVESWGREWAIALALLCLSAPSQAWAQAVNAEGAPAGESEAPAAAPSSKDVQKERDVPEGLYQPKPLDGVTIEALETYPNPLSNELGVGIGLYPFNPYYSGILLGANYLYNIDRQWAWEILNANFAFQFDKGLRTELADRFGVTPQQIERLQFLIQTNAFYTHTNGKFVLLREYIKYFRSSVMGGLGLVKTSFQSSIAVNIGLRFEVFTSERFAWRLDVRDTIAVSGFTHYVTFTLGTGFAF